MLSACRRSRSWPVVAPPPMWPTEGTSSLGQTSCLGWWAESKSTTTAFSVLVRKVPHFHRLSFNNSVSGPNEQCWTPLDCPILENAVPHLHVSNVEVSPGAQVHLSCDPGFYLLGEPVLQCQNKGEWSHPLPSCEREAQTGSDPCFHVYLID